MRLTPGFACADENLSLSWDYYAPTPTERDKHGRRRGVRIALASGSPRPYRGAMIEIEFRKGEIVLERETSPLSRWPDVVGPARRKGLELGADNLRLLDESGKEIRVCTVARLMRQASLERNT